MLVALLCVVVDGEGGVWVEAECCFSWVGGEPDNIGVGSFEGKGADPLDGGAVTAVQILCMGERIGAVSVGAYGQPERSN